MSTAPIVPQDAVDSEAAPGHAVEHEGYWIDPETGEVVGVVEPKPEFRVDSRQAAEWVLQKLMDAEADVFAIQAREKAVLDNLAAQKKAAARKAEWLRARFGPELEEFARQELAGQKGKTLTLDYGKVSFRAVAGKVTVADEARAMESFPEAVKVTKSLLISQVPKAQAAMLRDQGPDALLAAGLAWVEPSESVTIQTGVGK